MGVPEDQHNGEPATRWWRRRPAAGVASSLGTGAVAIWIASGLAPSGKQPLDLLAYLVSLPIALLLPAAALAAALIGWQAWQASTGPVRAALALPAFAALGVNTLAIMVFARVLVDLALR